ncbi:hypothetical protein [Bacillus sp. 1P06AnD]|uniref:hypothetical protein n=1 Tax=Bacillus sp. 1P06AnD TaxID=3132208 RepID=UPI0039A3BDF5
MSYHLFDEHVNPSVRFDGNRISLRIPVIRILKDNQAEIKKIQFYVLTKQEIIDSFVVLFEMAWEDKEHHYECFEYENEEKHFTYTYS